MKISELLNAISNKRPVIFHTPDDFLQINSKYSNGIVNGYEIIFRITNKCNIACEFCFNDSKSFFSKEKEIDFLFKTLSELNLEGSRIVISGGEPTTHPRFYDYLNLLKNSKAKIIVQTNAILFSNNKNIEKLGENNISFFVSLPSSKEEVYNSITNSKFFKNAVEGIKNLSLSYHVIINYVVYKKNYENFLDLINLVENNFNYENIKISISNLGMTQRFSNKDKLEKYSIMIPYLFKFFNYDKKFKIRFTTSGGCSFPLCIISKISPIKKKDLFKANEKSISINVLKDQFYKNSKCGKCKYNFYCQGFLKEYIELYGDFEIDPIV